MLVEEVEPAQDTLKDRVYRTAPASSANLNNSINIKL